MDAKVNAWQRASAIRFATMESVGKTLAISDAAFPSSVKLAVNRDCAKPPKDRDAIVGNFRGAVACVHCHYILTILSKGPLHLPSLCNNRKLAIRLTRWYRFALLEETFNAASTRKAAKPPEDDAPKSKLPKVKTPGKKTVGQ
ncbi:hypothetical protein ACO22_02940 [Paracoccidioides brasiliensis]|nr:hypothetical protein ACO22_02940 [Paracoccidioides brasiliensis]